MSNRYQGEYGISPKCTEMLKKKIENCYLKRQGFPSGSVVKNPPANAGATKDLGSFLCWEDPLEKEIAIHSSILAWKIPWTEAPGHYLQSVGSQRVRNDRVTEHTPGSFPRNSQPGLYGSCVQNNLVFIATFAYLYHFPYYILFKYSFQVSAFIFNP